MRQLYNYRVNPRRPHKHVDLGPPAETVRAIGSIIRMIGGAIRRRGER